MDDRFFRKATNYEMWYEMYKMALRGMNYGTFDLSVSGERNVLNVLKNKFGENPIIFDVGANIGNYSKMCKEVIPDCILHCFEPAIATYTELNRLLGGGAVLNNVGVSDLNTTGILYSDRDKSGLASIYKRQLDQRSIVMDKEEEIKLITLDAYCEENNINRIDLLKMDIEGNEYKALIGAERMLRDQRIQAIQIEFGGCNIDSRTYFRDYWNLLSGGFKVYRILEDGIREIKRYTENLEIFVTSNYLFILREDE